MALLLWVIIFSWVMGRPQGRTAGDAQDEAKWCLKGMGQICNGQVILNRDNPFS